MTSGVGDDEQCTKMFAWVATLVTTAESRREAWLRREQVIENIRGYLERLPGSTIRTASALAAGRGN